MPPRSRRTRAVPAEVARAGRAIGAVCALPQRLDDLFLPAAWGLGWAGMLALAVCGVLWALPAEARPPWPARSELPAATVLALALSSLLGWGYVQLGQVRIRRVVGRRASAVAFVFLPVVCAGLGLVASLDLLPAASRARTAPVWEFAEWYPPAAVVASLGTFLLWKSRPRSRFRPARAGGFALLVSPYVVLMAWLVFRVDAFGLDGPMHATLHALGRGAIALQLALAWFVGNPAGT